MMYSYFTLVEKIGLPLKIGAVGATHDPSFLHRSSIFTGVTKHDQI